MEQYWWKRCATGQQANSAEHTKYYWTDYIKARYTPRNTSSTTRYPMNSERSSSSTKWSTSWYHHTTIDGILQRRESKRSRIISSRYCVAQTRTFHSTCGQTYYHKPSTRSTYYVHRVDYRACQHTRTYTGSTTTTSYHLHHWDARWRRT